MTGPASGVDLVAIGELVVDLISTEYVEDLGAAVEFRRFLGGQPTNVATNVARLGGRTAMIATVGDDSLGAFAQAELARAGVDATHVVTDGRAPTSVVVVSRHHDTPDFIPYRGADRLIEADRLPVELIAGARVVHASAFALSEEPARSAVLATLEAARSGGAFVSFDPNYHAILWGPEPPHETLRRALAHVDVVKPSLDDCARLFGPAGAPETYVERFLDWGVALVVLTLGRDGVLVGDRERGLRRYPTRGVDVQDVTGAGDAFWSGMLMAAVDGLPTEERICVGLEVAAVKLRRVGPLPDGLDREEIYGRARDALAMDGDARSSERAAGGHG